MTSSSDFKVTLLGTGVPTPSPERFGPSTLVEAGNQKLIFDCGRGCTQRLYQQKVPFSEVTALFLTHLHSDHIVGVPDLWLTGWIVGRKTPLRVWGPSGTRQMMKHLEEAYAFDIHIRRDVDEQIAAPGVVVEAKDIEQGVVYDSGGVKVTAFTVDHGAVKPALGYRVDYAGHSVVLSGDTRYSENLIKFAQGTDVLKLFVGKGLILTLIGIGIGLLGALGVTRVMQTLLFGISTTDWITFTAVAIFLTLVGLIATAIPARRAIKVDPLVALRYE